jgi:hypothetical protein
MEKSKADVAEKARASLEAELNLIKKQLDLEQENIERCKRFLEPEDLA